MPAATHASIRDALRDAEARSVRATLAPCAAVIGLFYAVLAPAHWLVLDAATRVWLTPVAALSALACLALWLRWRRHPPVGRHAHVLMALLASFVLVNSTLHLLLVPEPRQTTNLALMLVGAGFLFLSHAWFGITLLTAWGAFALALVLAPASSEWTHFGFLLLAASALAVATHGVRLQMHRGIERARIASETERSRAEQALRAMTVELRARNLELEQRNRELDDFAYVASHDLQEPLRKLASFSALLEDDLGRDLPEKAAIDLRFIREAAVRMQELVRDLLALSRAGTTELRREPVALDVVVDRALDDLSLRVAESGAEIGREPLPTIDADFGLALALYRNLLANALRFADGVPRVELTAERDPESGWLLGVRDHGPGVPADAREEIFKPFRRLSIKDGDEGTGIGLAICRKAVERHGGRIWVEAAPDGGAWFRFSLEPAPASRASQSSS